MLLEPLAAAVVAQVARGLAQIFALEGQLLEHTLHQVLLVPERIMVVLQLVVKGLLNLGFLAELSHLRVELLLHPELYVVREELVLLGKAQSCSNSPMLISLSIGPVNVLRLQQMVDPQGIVSRCSVVFLSEHLSEVVHDWLGAAERVALRLHYRGARVLVHSLLAEPLVTRVDCVEIAATRVI